MERDLRTRVEDYLRTAAPHVRDRQQYKLIEELHRTMLGMVHAPIRMLLACPKCSHQHIDKPDPARGWDNPPHRSHECQHCGHIWRPCDAPTEGVETLITKGQRDGTALPEVITIEDCQNDLRQWFEEWRTSAQGVLYFPTARSFLDYCLTRLCARTL